MKRFYFLGILIFSPAVFAEEAPVWRKPTSEEVVALFRVSTRHTDQSHVTADAVFFTQAWTDEQVEAEIKRQEELMHRLGVKRKASAELTAARRKGIREAHSGTRTFHLEDWYFGGFHRSDFIDGGISYPDKLTQNTKGMFESKVDIFDPSFSPYYQYSVNHIRKEVHVRSAPAPHFYSHYLWQAMSMNPALARPLWETLAIRENNAFLAITRLPYAGTSQLKPDAIRVAALLAGNSGQEIKVAEDYWDHRQALRFQLKSSITGAKGPLAVVAEYWIAPFGGTYALLKGSLTEVDLGQVITSEHREIDEHGVPSEIENVTSRPNQMPERIVYHYKSMEWNPRIDPKVVFLPKFPDGYVVADFMSGMKPTYLAGHAPSISRFSPPEPQEYRRQFVIFGILLLAAVPLFLIAKAKFKPR